MDGTSGSSPLRGGLSLAALLSCFPLAGGGIEEELFEEVTTEEVPAPYAGLLVHEHHMTVTLEKFFAKPVVLHVHRVHQDGHVYARELSLSSGPNGPVVMAGIMRLRLEATSPAVREEILAEGTPLGRILIEHDVLRWIRLHSLLRVRRGCRFPELWAASRGAELTYGRLAMIWCDEQPAVELLEVVTPIAKELV